jgi:hypothetical protein
MITEAKRCLGIALMALSWASLSAQEAPAATKLAKPAAPSPLDFYLLIGQSNMAGRGKYQPGDAFPRGRAYVLNGEGVFVELQPYPFINHHSTIRKSAAQISPGYSFGLTLLAAHPETPIGFVSNARGGTPIREWVKGTEYFNEAVRRTQQAVAQGGVLKGILWHQGETDFREILMRHPQEKEKYCEEYMQTLRQFIADLRTELGAEQVPFVAGQVNQGFGLFNEMIVKLPGQVDRTLVVTTEGLTTVDDSHFDRDSVLELGKRYAAKILEFQASHP